MINGEVEFVPNYEVSEFFCVPVSHLVNPKNRDVRERKRGGKVRNDYVFAYGNHIIWGLTGRILDELFKKLRDVLRGERVSGVFRGSGSFLLSTFVCISCSDLTNIKRNLH